MRRGRRRGAGGTDPEAGALGPEVGGAEAGTRRREGVEASTGWPALGPDAGARSRSRPRPAGMRAVEAEQPDGAGRAGAEESVREP